MQYSYCNEANIISALVEKIGRIKHSCVDIAASDGAHMSNSLHLYQQGWSGLAVECDSEKFRELAVNYSVFPRVNLQKCMVTPQTINHLLSANHIPHDFGVLSLDLDGYDYFVLEQLLSSNRPTVICAEINEKIPPPIRFTVLYSEDYSWNKDHFYGQSLCQLMTLADRFSYDLIALEYNNAFLVPRDIAQTYSLRTMTASMAFEHGYVQRTDRLRRFPWNHTMEAALTMKPPDALAFIRRFFRPYSGRFMCEI